ncbi:NAD(P)/FAD-dependent oxidoreductase [Microbacterium sp. JB110]|nr:NAD(P)/FAD-dependent oxidoreductase [Microbacterium sp. JB110]
MPASMRVVVVGFGPVAVRFAEELLPQVRDGLVALTIIGAEREDPYNRVLTAEYAVGEAERGDLDMADTVELAASGIAILRGRRAIAIDREARTVELDQGAPIGYDRLVLATGARANVPRLDGLHTVGRDSSGLDDRLVDGVMALRSLDDADRLRELTSHGGSAVVLGAGVLGIELALLLARAGIAVRLAHFGPIPMSRQLDRGSGAVTAAVLAEAGIEVVPHARAEAIVTEESAAGSRRFSALVSGDGKRIPGDVLILSCGVTARDDLAVAADLRTGRGVLVDERLRSFSDESVHAIGDCAHMAERAHLHDAAVPGAPSGLIGPGWRQAEWLARSIAADAVGAEQIEAFGEDVPAVVSVKGIDVVAAGDVDVDPFAPVPRGETGPGVSMWADPDHGAYTKMVTRDGVLTGFVSVGMPRTGAELSVLYARRGELPSDRSLLLRLDADDDAAPRATGRDETVCVCNAVTAGAIEDAVTDGCDTVADVGSCTRAGTGCGTCRGRITRMLEELEASPL